MTEPTPVRTASIISLSACEGTLSLDEQKTLVVFDLTVAWDGQVRLSFRPIMLTDATSWLLQPAFPGDLFLPRLRLTATGPEGEELSSDHVYITSAATPDVDGKVTLDLTAQAEPLRVRYAHPPGPHKRRIALYATVGMRGFSTPSCEAPEGTVTLGGPHSPTDYSAIGGIITVETADTSAPVEAWFTKCDDLIARILDIVSLGQGRYIRYSLRECYVNDELAQRDFYGAKASTDPYQPCFHHLNMQPVLELAVKQYTSALRDDAGIGIAVEWLLMHANYTEGKYLTAFAALEHLLSVLGKDIPTTILDPKTFEQLILPRLQHALDDARAALPDSPNDSFDILRGKLDGLNNHPIANRLTALLRQRRVPTSDIADRIPPALHPRNTLLHRGRYTGAEPLQEHLTVLRELVVRTILTLLNFHGSYESYLRDPTWGPFPPPSNTTPAADPK